MGLTIANFLSYSEKIFLERSQGFGRQEKNWDFMTLKNSSFSSAEDLVAQFAESLFSPSQLHLGTSCNDFLGVEEHLSPRI